MQTQASDQQAEPSVGVGWIGLGLAGRYHLEQVSQCPGLHSVAAWDSAAEHQHWVRSRGITLCRSAAEIIERRDVGLVCIDIAGGHSAEVVQQALQAGKRVALAAPLAWSTTECEAVEFALQTQAGQLWLLEPELQDGTWLALRELVASGQLGRLRLLQYWARRYSVSAAAHHSTHMLWREVARGLRQLVELAGESLQIVEVEEVLSSRNAQAPEWIVRLETPFHARASLHLATRALAPQAEGWILEGDAAGYRESRVYRLAADGEHLDTPLEPHLSDPSREFQQLAQFAANGPTSESGQRWEFGKQVCQLLDVMRERLSAL